MRRIIHLLAVFAVLGGSLAVVLPAEPAGAASYAAIASPNTELLDGQVVSVYWSGYTGIVGMDIRQCKSQVFDVNTDCSRSYGGVSDVDGTGTSQIRVVREVTAADTKIASGTSTTAGSKTLTTNGDFFAAGDVGKAVSGSGIPTGAKIASFTNTRSAEMDLAATASTVLSQFQVGTGSFVCDADNPCGFVVQRANRDPATRSFAPLFFAGASRPLTACDDESPSTLVTSTGGSATIAAFQRWIQQLCQPLAGKIAVDYNNRNSPDGRAAYIDQLSDFGVSSMPFTDAELAKLKAQGRDSDFIYIPIAASALGITYNAWYQDPNPPNLPNREVYRQIRDLCVSPGTAARLLTGQVSYLYDGNGYPDNNADPTIVRDNPQLVPLAQASGRPLASPIAPVARADASSSSFELTSWFQSEINAKSAWDSAGDEFRAAKVTENFPAARNVAGRTLSQNVMKLMTTFGNDGTRGTGIPRSSWFTYADITVARASGLPVAKIMNPKTGVCVEPTPESIGLGIAAMTTNKDGVTKSTNFGADVDPRAYPLPTITYAIVPTKGLAADKTGPLKAALSFMVGPGQERLGELGYVPLPTEMQQLAIDQVSKLPGVTSEFVPAASASSAGSITDLGLLDNSLLVPGQSFDQSLTPLGVDSATASASPTKGDGSTSIATDLIRYVTSPGSLVAILLFVLGFAALAGGPILQGRARRAERRGL